MTVCFVLENEKSSGVTELATRDAPEEQSGGEAEEERISSAARLAEKVARKRSERSTYLVAAVMSSLGITSMAIAAVYYRFSWQMEVNFFTPVFFPLFFLFGYGYRRSINFSIKS